MQSNFIAQAPVSGDPADTLTRVNNALLRRAIEARFATMFHGVVDQDGCLSYCNGGQEPPLVLGRNAMAWLETGGPVLGLLPRRDLRMRHGDARSPATSSSSAVTASRRPGTRRETNSGVNG